MRTTEMIMNHPVKPQYDAASMDEFLQAVAACEQACISCADACLAEETRGQLVRCISINNDCADICMVTGRLVSRQTAPDLKVIQSQVQTLAIACNSCKEECRRHSSKHEHCRVCAEACARCADSCANLLTFFPITVGQDSR